MIAGGGGARASSLLPGFRSAWPVINSGIPPPACHHAQSRVACGILRLIKWRLLSVVWARFELLSLGELRLADH